MQNHWTLFVALLIFGNASLADSNKLISELERKIQENDVKLQMLSLQIEAQLQQIDFNVNYFELNQKNNNELLQCQSKIEELQSKIDLQDEENIIQSLREELRKLQESFTSFLAEKSTEFSQAMIEYNNSKTSADKLKKTGLEALPKSCPESISVDGIYEIEVPNIGPLPVYCESSWTLIQRKCCDLSFDRKWNEYKAGFGSISDEFFIGLENLHQMTSSQPYELFIQLRDHSENVRFAQYDHFLIGNETEGYELKSLGRYSGTIGDILRNSRNRKFSTSDNNKSWFSTEGGWWLDSWNSGNLNGKRTKIWVEDLRNYFVVKASKMWIRPKVNPSN